MLNLNLRGVEVFINRSKTKTQESFWNNYELIIWKKNSAGYTDTSSTSFGGTVGGAGLVQKAYDRLLEFALRSEPLIRSVADKRPARQAIPGSTNIL